MAIKFGRERSDSRDPMRERKRGREGWELLQRLL
jgi:hypothetical protein